MLGLIGAGVGALVGGFSAWSQQREARSQAKAFNRNIQNQLKEIKGQREQSVQRQSMTSGDFLNQYAMIRDPQRSQGIQQMYSQNVNTGVQERAGLDNQTSRLTEAKVNVPTAPGFGTILEGGLGGGMSGWAMGAGLESGGDKNPGPASGASDMAADAQGEIDNMYQFDGNTIPGMNAKPGSELFKQNPNKLNLGFTTRSPYDEYNSYLYV